MSRQFILILILAGTLLLLGGAFAGYRLGLSNRGPAPAAHTQEGQGHEDEHGEEEGHVEGRVHLEPDQQAEAGIQVDPVRAREVQSSFQATGELTGAPDLQVRVKALLPGRVTSLLAEPGDRVAAGATLAILESPQVAQARSDRRAAGVRLEQARVALEQRRRLAHLGDEVRSALEEARQEVVEARAATRSARAAEDLARRNLDRITALRDQGIASRQQFEQARTSFEQAHAESERAGARLDLATGHLAREEAIRSQGLRVSREVTEAETEVRLAEEEVRKADDLLALLGAAPGGEGNSVAIVAPRGGVVVSRPVTPGEAVEGDEELFTLLETSRLWLEIGIPERDLPRTSVGSSVRVQVPAWPQRTFTGRIASISPQVDESTRTMRARVSIDNTEHLLRPGMFATVSVGVGRRTQAAAVPESALQVVEGKPAVYVAVDPETFERRRVELGAREDGWVQIVRGLSPGERVATSGAFFLKSEDQRETMGGHSH